MKCVNTRCSACGNCDLTEFECALYKYPTAPAKRKEKPAKSLTTEDNEQIAVIEYCELKGIVVVHIPNEAKRSAANAAKMKRMGLRKGFPDLLFPTPRNGFCGLVIELKRDRASKPTAEQLAWIGYLNGQGYRATVCYGAGEAIKEIENYFGD